MLNANISHQSLSAFTKDFSNIAIVTLPESLSIVDISLRILHKFRNNFYKEHLKKASSAVFHEITKGFLLKVQSCKLRKL